MPFSLLTNLLMITGNLVFQNTYMFYLQLLHGAVLVMRLEEDYLNRILICVFIACDGSTNAHPPEHLIYKKLGMRPGTQESEHVPKAFKILRREGLICAHPTRGGQTVQLTKAGHKKVINLFKQKPKSFDKRLNRHLSFIKEKGRD